MDIDKIIEAIKGDIGKPTVLGKWVFCVLGKSEGTGFNFESLYEITRVVKEDQRIKVLINVQLFDSWELFQQEAQRIFINVVKGQITDSVPGIEDLLDIVIVEQGG